MTEYPTLPEGAVLDSSPPMVDKDKLPPLPDGAAFDDESVETKSEPQFNPYSISSRLRSMLGVADIAKTGLTSGLAEVASGVSGSIALLFTQDPDYAKERVDAVQNFLTVGLATEAGEEMISKIIPPLSRADLAIKDFAEERAGGDPKVAAAIETAIWSSIDIAGAAVPAAKGAINARKIRKMRQQVVDDANRLGINLTLEDFADDLADAAKLVGSEVRGQEAEEYVKALRNAEYLAKLKKNSLYAEALDKDLYMSTSPMRRLGAELTQKLDGPFDLDAEDMWRVRRTLDDMHSNRLGFGAGQNLAVHFSKVEMIRKRVNNRIKGAKGPEKAALYQIKQGIDEMLTNEFNNAVIQNGKIKPGSSALSGDADGMTAYLSARKANQEWAWFNETKVIADLIKKDTTPEQFSQWLIGASAVGAKKEAAAVVKKMKQLLGDDHPAIDAVRADFIYELTEPLLQMEPNFKQFANNYDRVLRKNSSLAGELGLTDSDVQILADFAAVEKKLPKGGHIYTIRDINKAISQMVVGHSVARGSARVTFARRMMNWAAGVDAVSPKQIISEVIGVRSDVPLVASSGKVGLAFVSGAAISGMADEGED